MDTFVATALVGTAQAGAREATTGTPVDALAAALAAGDAERRLLLQAGARAIYQRAGYVPARVAALPPPAPQELLPACSPAAALLLTPLLAGMYDDLLPEALERLRQAGLRLPYDLLPAALGLRTNALRALVAPLLGARGRWLAGFNPAWSWVGQTLGDMTNDVPADAETIWNEGSAGQRVAVLRRLRAVDVAKAREWVAAVWKSEKAETRAEMLKASEIGLGAEDEPLLEAALDDRAAGVRAAAPTLLARLPGSAFAGRVRERADAMLLWKDGKLDARPPKTLDPAALRDGIAEQASQAKGQRAYWLMQTLALVPPGHWEEHFGQSAEALIAAAADSDWSLALLEGLSRAALAFTDARWATALWSFWRQWGGKGKRSDIGARDELLQAFMPLVPRELAEHFALHLLTDPSAQSEAEAYEVLDALPRPWSAAFGAAYLYDLRLFLASLDAKSTDAVPWDRTLAAAAHALPLDCFAAVLEPFTLPEDNKNWYIVNFGRQLETFADTLRIRQRLFEEIPV
jgi:hypothetical protein